MTDEPPEKMRERAERNGYKNGTQYGSLLSQVKYSGMLPTPTTQEPTSQCELTESGRRKTKDGKDSHSLNLGRVAAMLPTPTTDSATNRKDKYKQGGTPLSVAVNQMLPTPTAFDYNSARTPETYEKAKARHAEKGVNLQMPLKQMARNGMLPTPTTSCANGGTKAPRKDGKTRESELNHWATINRDEAQATGKTSQLNPQFVEEMMGFPENWTASPFQSGATKV